MMDEDATLETKDADDERDEERTLELTTLEEDECDERLELELELELDDALLDVVDTQAIVTM